MPMHHFRAHNLVATIGPFDPLAVTTCPSRSCCSAFDCFYSILIPGPGLTPADLPALIRDLRSKLDVERHGIDLALTAASDQEATQWRQALEGEGLSDVGNAESP
jgi:hypothetical protein